MYPTTLLALVATLCALGSSHMILEKPVPWGVDTIDNSPLDNAFPGNYPCKQRTGVYALPSTGYNKFAVGSQQTVSFKGSATHGGGSCQISVTTDLHPTVSSTFKVIYSILGTCPEQPFSFTVPPGLPNGKYTMAWTWFNKVGNRELYMNCAPIDVSNGTDTLNGFNKLPDMYTINLPSTGCASEDSKDLVFPNPGKYATTAAGAALATSGPTGSECAKQILIGAGSGKATLPAGTAAAVPAASTGAPVASGSSSAMVTVSVSAPSGFVTSVRPASPATAAPAQTSATAYSLPNVYPPPSSAAAPVPSSAPMPQYSSSAAAAPSAPATSSASAGTPVPAAPSAGTALPSPMSSAAAPYPYPVVSAPAPPLGTGSSGSSYSGGSGSSSSGVTTCTTDNALLCNADGSMFALCNHGKGLWQAVAAGTKCVGGQIV